MTGEQLLVPMPYRLTVNDAIAVRGTLPEVRATVAHLVSGWLADDPEGLAEDAQKVNAAWTGDEAKNALQERGEWYALVGVHSDHQTMRLRVVREG
jgi:hypothetical protein